MIILGIRTLTLHLTLKSINLIIEVTCTGIRNLFFGKFLRGKGPTEIYRCNRRVQGMTDGTDFPRCDSHPLKWSLFLLNQNGPTVVNTSYCCPRQFNVQFPLLSERGP